MLGFDHIVSLVLLVVQPAQPVSGGGEATAATAAAPTPPGPSGPGPNPRAADAEGGRLAPREVERAAPGQWAMQFTFGGLAPLSLGSVSDRGVGRLLVSELGFRRVFKRVSFPFSVGAGIFHHADDGEAAANDAGVAASVAVLAGFRTWRRIAPFAGGALHVHYLDPSGASNWLVNVAAGPVAGIEYFVADRVSLIFQGNLLIGVNIARGATQVSAGTSIAAGGNTGLVFYF